MIQKVLSIAFLLFALLYGYKFYEYFLLNKKSQITQQSNAFENAKIVASKDEKIGFCIIISSYNNFPYIKANINSIFGQDYHNWRLIYIDDKSTDGTGEAIEQIKLISELGDEKFTVIHNEKNVRASIANTIYAAYNFCHNDEVMTLVDGDDLLANKYVLRKLSQEYKNPDIWLTYGEYVTIPGGEWDILNTDFTDEQWKNLRAVPHNNTVHLRTNYTWLFKQIKLEDFKYKDGTYIQPADYVYFLPLTELAGKEHSKHIKDILYLYRRHLNNEDAHSLEQQINGCNYVRSLAPYTQLKAKPQY